MTTSEQINELAAALAQAQAEMGGAVKDSANPFFKSKYADLASVREACIGPLTKHGLSVLQSPELEGSVVVVETLLMHSSGQWIAGRVRCEAKDTSPQAVGSAITYLRRYALQSFAGVAPEDDDGEAAHGRPFAPHTPAPPLAIRPQEKREKPSAPNGGGHSATSTTPTPAPIPVAGREDTGRADGGESAHLSELVNTASGEVEALPAGVERLVKVERDKGAVKGWIHTYPMAVNKPGIACFKEPLVKILEQCCKDGVLVKLRRKVSVTSGKEYIDGVERVELPASWKPFTNEPPKADADMNGWIDPQDPSIPFAWLLPLALSLASLHWVLA